MRFRPRPYPEDWPTEEEQAEEMADRDDMDRREQAGYYDPPDHLFHDRR